jgi:hypothetical protein
MISLGSRHKGTQRLRLRLSAMRCVSSARISSSNMINCSGKLMRDNVIGKKGDRRVQMTRAEGGTRGDMFHRIMTVVT